MKNSLCGWILACLLALPSICSADLLIYRGNMNMRRAGNGGESRHVYRVYVIMDQATAQVTKINYYPFSGGLFYSVDDPVPFSTNSVQIAFGKVNTVLAQGGSWVNESNQVTVSSALVKGTNVRLPVKQGVHTVFPRLFDWNYSGVRPLPDSTSSETWQETGMLNFYQASTIYANAHQETAAEAEARLTADLEAQGYREVTLK